MASWRSFYNQTLHRIWFCSNQQEEFDYFKGRILKSMARIPGKMAERDGLLLAFNTQGTKPPLFWCFNGWSEAVILSRYLGKDQPLYAMHSFEMICKNDGSKTLHRKALAKLYAKSIHRQASCHDFFASNPLVIGGNCQAAPIAEATAHQLKKIEGQWPTLISLDHDIYYAYPGKLFLLFGRQSEEFNPFLQQVDSLDTEEQSERDHGGPVQSWKHLHTCVRWGEIDCDHGGFFRSPAVQQLVLFIQNAVEPENRQVQASSCQKVIL